MTGSNPYRRAGKDAGQSGLSIGLTLDDFDGAVANGHDRRAADSQASGRLMKGAVSHPGRREAMHLRSCGTRTPF